MCIRDRDAYHSLSIEGYRVSPELIEKVRVGNWKPEEEDKEHKNALVAVSYTHLDVYKRQVPYFHIWGITNIYYRCCRLI